MRSTLAAVSVVLALVACTARREAPRYVTEGPLLAWAAEEAFYEVPLEVYEHAVAELEAGRTDVLELPLGEALVGRLPARLTPEVQGIAVGLIGALIEQDEGEQPAPDVPCQISHTVVRTGDGPPVVSRPCYGDCEEGEECDKVRVVREGLQRVYCGCTSEDFFEGAPARPPTTCHLEVRRRRNAQGGWNDRLVCVGTCEDGLKCRPMRIVTEGDGVRVERFVCVCQAPPGGGDGQGEF